MKSIVEKLTPAERKLFEEHVIHEYKAKHHTTHHFYDDLTKKLKRFVPFNIGIGLLACIGVIYLQGWRTLIYIFLWGIIGLTLISTVLATLLGKK
jgi:hypothetical protein